MQRRSLILVAFNSLALFLLFFVFFIIFTIRLKYPYLVGQSSDDSIKFNKTSNQPDVRFRLLIGILMRADSYDRRHFLRLIYGIQSSPLAEVDVKFVFCNLTKPEQRTLIALEILRFDDIIILNCTENMNSGKTYTYFSSLPRILPRRYDYVMKADDDVFLRIVPLVASLKPLPRWDLYYGFVIPCLSMDPHVEYMSGMGFVLSWDIVQWIGRSEIPRNEQYGPEDKLVGRWLKLGGKARHRYTEKPGMYDYPGTNGKCSHELIPQTVAVHRLKKWDQWFRVLEFFNITKELKHSKLYHL